MKNKYPYEVLLEDAPNSSELNFQFSEDGVNWWEEMTPEGVIAEVTEILGRYNAGSGWVHAGEIEDGSKSAIQERNDLRKVLAYIKRQYKKHNGGK